MNYLLISRDLGVAFAEGVGKGMQNAQTRAGSYQDIMDRLATANEYDQSHYDEYRQRAERLFDDLRNSISLGLSSAFKEARLKAAQHVVSGLTEQWVEAWSDKLGDIAGDVIAGNQRKFAAYLKQPGGTVQHLVNELSVTASNALIGAAVEVVVGKVEEEGGDWFATVIAGGVRLDELGRHMPTLSFDDLVRAVEIKINVARVKPGGQKYIDRFKESVQRVNQLRAVADRTSVWDREELNRIRMQIVDALWDANVQLRGVNLGTVGQPDFDSELEALLEMWRETRSSNWSRYVLEVPLR